MSLTSKSEKPIIRHVVIYTQEFAEFLVNAMSDEEARYLAEYDGGAAATPRSIRDSSRMRTREYNGAPLGEELLGMIDSRRLVCISRASPDVLAKLWLLRNGSERKGYRR